MIAGSFIFGFVRTYAYSRPIRINWSGSALSTFYAAIRKALVVVIVARALGVLFGLAFATWWIFGQ
jgi:hypothetical protein